MLRRKITYFPRGLRIASSTLRVVLLVLRFSTLSTDIKIKWSKILTIVRWWLIFVIYIWPANVILSFPCYIRRRRQIQSPQNYRFLNWNARNCSNEYHIWYQVTPQIFTVATEISIQFVELASRKLNCQKLHISQMLLNIRHYCCNTGIHIHNWHRQNNLSVLF
jgi:hypothetical protein